MTVIKKGKPWPIKATMQQVYRDRLWGDNGTEFYSGFGSHHPQLVAPYIKVLTKFLRSFATPITVCDLGCGDFNIGKELVPYTKKYIAIDIVPELIAYNRKKFNYPNLEFQCLDIAKDDVPRGDCVILRHVLQHLSNAEVKKTVSTLYNFKYVLLTEHIPAGEFLPNKDIVSGQGIRLKKQSGLELFKAPFYLKVKEKKQLLSLEAMGYKGRIITTMLKMF